MKEVPDELRGFKKEVERLVDANALMREFNDLTRDKHRQVTGEMEAYWHGVSG